MDLSHTDLLLIWFAGGFVVCLAWAALLGQMLIGEQRTTVRPALGFLAVAGLLNPVAAFGAADLVRLTRSLDDPELELPAWALPATVALGVVSVAIAVALWITAGDVS